MKTTPAQRRASYMYRIRHHSKVLAHDRKRWHQLVKDREIVRKLKAKGVIE